MKIEIAKSSDELLLPFLTSETDAETEECLNLLFSESVIPQIRMVLSPYLTLSSDDREEIAAEVQGRILRRLRGLHVRPETAIADLKAYVTTATFNARKDFISSKKPEWRRINNRIQRLAEDPERGIRVFARRDGDDRFGLDGHDGNENSRDIADILEAVRQRIPDHLVRRVQDLVPEVLACADGGISRKELVGAVLELTGGGEFVEIELPEELGELRTVSENDEMISERQISMLRQIWDEVRTFPGNQRKALILSLRESRDTEAVSLLLRNRIATIKEIAEALEVDLEEFSAIFERLPMSSLEIADFLSIEDSERTSRDQRVDNLRRIARDLLRRRLSIKR